MKTLLAIIVSLIIFAPISKTKAQQIDTFDYVNHNGVIFITQNKSTLSFSQIKKQVKVNPTAFEQFKKARRIRNVSFVLEVISSTSSVIAIVSENETLSIACFGSSILITGLDLALSQTPFNKAMMACIQEYNKPYRNK